MKATQINALKKAEAYLKAVAAANPGFYAEFKNGALVTSVKKMKSRKDWGTAGQAIIAKIRSMKSGDCHQFLPPAGVNIGELQQYCSYAGMQTFGPGRTMTSRKTGNGTVEVLIV